MFSIQSAVLLQEELYRLIFSAPLKAKYLILWHFQIWLSGKKDQ